MTGTAVVATLDPFTVPLGGTVAIEASAGTGKTFTITQLYVRLLLEAGLTVDQILVVTYTKAATAELRERLRAQLASVREALEAGTADEPFCRRVVERTSDRDGAIRLLTQALHGFDEAAVFTIHGFCQRVLAEHAFESGALFETELVPDDRALVQEVVDDFWRRELYDASPGFVRWALEKARLTPDALAKLVRSYAARSYRDIDAPADPPDLAEREAAFAAEWAAVRARFGAEWPAVDTLLCETGAIRRNSYRVVSIRQWGPAIEDALADDVPDPRLSAPLKRLASSALRAATKPKYTTPSHPLFDACERLLRTAEPVCEAYEARVGALRARLLREAPNDLAARKQTRRVQSYDDLVGGLAHALADPARGERLADAVRTRYRAALIDEFQDTDPVQYDIVRRVWGGTAAPVFLVGDPKQAIYGFRGADVFAYLKARDDAQEQRPLARNWRSVPRLIEAVNALFAGSANPFVVEKIPFLPARAGDEPPAPLVVDGDRDAPLRLWLLDRGAIGRKDDQRNAAAAVTAAEIARLIGLGDAGRARIGDQPVNGGHIAVLVRRNVDGRAMREHLLALGIPSVQQAVDSVYGSREAIELERVLLAVADPGQPRLLRAALATEMLGVGARALLDLDDDERAWERRVDAFHDYRQRWRSGGFAMMLREVLRNEDVPRRLLAFDDGERRLTNLLHLGELLQAEWLAAPGAIDALVEGLADARRAAAWDAEEQQLRLESDDHLVKIVTVHKSKGLQYPIVFCPYLWDFRRAAPGDEPVLVHETDGDPRPTLDMGSPSRPARLVASKREELAEAVRLLYVAVTRAQQRCYLVWGRLADGGTSPLAWLLHAPPGASSPDEVKKRYDTLTMAGVEADLAPLVARGGGAVLVEAPPTGVPTAPPRRREAPLPAVARRLREPIRPRWAMTSFSGLIDGADAERPDYDVVRVPAPARAPRTHDLFGFPRGARAGRCLHGVLEHVDFTADATAWAPVVRRMLATHGFEATWEPVLIDMVRRVVATPLDESGAVRLDRVPLAARVTEREFHHPIGRLDGAALARLLLRHEFGTGPIREAVARARIAGTSGFMKGFIDLVCRCDGRYWLVDYKSNWLGDALDQYAGDRLAEVVATDGYWLQYLIYTLVVHRWLRRRVAGYDYDRHVGGVRYLFLRGMDPARGLATGVHRDRPSKALVEALDAFMTPDARGDEDAR